MFFGRNGTKAETPVLRPPHAKSWLIGKKDWCWEGLGAGGEGDDRGWDGWMALLTRWTWVSVNSRSWCWTGRPGMLRFMGSQRVSHDWATDLIWSDHVISGHICPQFTTFGFQSFEDFRIVDNGLWTWISLNKQILHQERKQSATKKWVNKPTFKRRGLYTGMRTWKLDHRVPYWRLPTLQGIEKYSRIR